MPIDSATTHQWCHALPETDSKKIFQNSGETRPNFILKPRHPFQAFLFFINSRPRVNFKPRKLNLKRKKKNWLKLARICLQW